MSYRRLLIGGAVLLLVLFVVQRLSSPRDATEIERAIKTVATSTDPAYCDRLTTQRYLGQVTGERAPFADEVCESEAGRTAADSVDVRKVTVTGDRATALVANTGGSLDGSSVVVRLVEDDDWSLDRVVALADFDRMRFRRAYRKKLLGLGFSKGAADCVLDSERRFSNAEIEHAVLQPADSLFATLVVECDRGAVARNVRKALADPPLGFPQSGIECGERRLEAATDDELMRIQLDALTYNELLFRCDRRAMLSYLKRGLEATGGLDAATVECVLEALRGLPSTRVIHLIYADDSYEALIESCAPRS